MFETSVLNNPMTASANALSQLSPALPTDMPILASASRLTYRMDTYCLPRSEWWVKDPIAGRRWQMARLRASRTKLVVIEVETRHPTMFRAKVSMTKAAQAVPIAVCT